MKKNLLFTVILFAAAQSLFSQEHREDKTTWIDFQAVQQTGLSGWSNAGYVNAGLPSASITEIRGVLNSRLIGRLLYGFVDMGMGIMPAPDMKSFTLDGMPTPYNGTQYYLREMLSESGTNNTSAHFKLTAGLFVDIPATEKWTVMPHLGVGGITMEKRSCEMILKEQGSNMQYHTMYVWGYKNSENYNDDSAMFGYLTGRLNFKYKISPKSSLLLGLEYTHFFNSLDFYGRYYNTFNENIRRDFIVKGNKMNMIGISAGISFR